MISISKENNFAHVVFGHGDIAVGIAHSDTLKSVSLTYNELKEPQEIGTIVDKDASINDLLVALEFYSEKSIGVVIEMLNLAKEKLMDLKKDKE